MRFNAKKEGGELQGLIDQLEKMATDLGPAGPKEVSDTAPLVSISYHLPPRRIKSAKLSCMFHTSFFPSSFFGS